MYHVMNPGDRREAIFVDDIDRQLFIATLGEACEKTDWQIHAWCLMSNHFHLVAETPQANLVEGMQWLVGVCTNRFNHRQKEFAGRMEARHRAEGSGGYEPQGWCLGSEEFRQELVAQVSAQAGPRHTGD
jgi:REP element-mobilizing transposase RayT